MTARGPRAAGKVAKERQAAEIHARYDAAGTGRRVAGWNAPSTGPQRSVEGLATIRNRAHDVQRNDWAGASSTQKWTTTLVGVGITPRWEDEALEEDWKLTVPEIDADGTSDAYGLQALGVRSLVGTGEVFMRHRPRPLGAPLNAPFQVQLIESDFVPLLDTDYWPDLPSGHVIKQGVEFDKYGQRQAYWSYKSHPGDKPLTPQYNDLVRIPARFISHVFEPKRPGQIRGVSDLAPILVRLRASMDFEDAVLDRMKLANLFVMFITRAIPDFSRLEVDPKTGLPVCYDSKGRPIAALEPGISQELDPGQDVKFANPPEPGVSYPDYMRSTHMGTASGQGLPYELFAGDIKDISDRTLRVIMNEFRRYAEQRQWHAVIPKLCQPMVNWWAEAKYRSGQYSLERMLRAQRGVEWSPHGWEYIHPTQDVQGKVLAIQNGLDSRVNTIGKRGDSARRVAKDRKLDETLGLVPPPPPAAPAPAGSNKQPAKAQDVLTFGAFDEAFEARWRQAAVEGSRESVRHMQALESILGLITEIKDRQGDTSALEKVAASIAAIAARPVEIHAHLPEPKVENNIAVNPTPIENHTHVSPAPVVNEVTVLPAPVEVDVKLPDRQTTSEIEHDEKGRIVNVTQTEKTIQ